MLNEMAKIEKSMFSPPLTTLLMLSSCVAKKNEVDYQFLKPEIKV